MREKLIYLVRVPIKILPDKIMSPTIQFTMPYAEEVAENLIANGVTIPVRCKDCAKREFSAFDGCEWCDPCGYKCIDPEWYCPKGVRK